MQVEVNEQNIVKYGLVQLTGNSVEVLLTTAREAEISGYILTVNVPEDQLIHLNLFDVAESQEVSEEDLRRQNEATNPIVSEEDLRNGLGWVVGAEIVQGEVIESRDEEI